MAYIEGEGRNQGTLFPVVLDDLVSADHMCRVVDAFVSQLEMEELGFERSQPADTGRPGYNPRSLLKLYLYGYLNQIRSSRRIFGHPRLLLRGRVGAHTELSLAVMAYNLKRMANVLGNAELTQALQKN